MASGRTLRELFDNMLAIGMLYGTVYHRGGLFIGASLPIDVHHTITPKVIRRQKVNDILCEFWRDIATEWRPNADGSSTLVYPREHPTKITTLLRDEWYAYAHYLGSAYHQNKRLLRPKLLGIIKRGGVLMSGRNAFIRCNGYAESCDWPFPRRKPPAGIIGVSNPTMPIIERVWLEGERIWIAIEEPLFDDGWKERAIRVWGAIQYCGLTYFLDIVSVINVKGINRTTFTSKTPKRYVLFSMDTFELSKWMFSVDSATMAELDNAKILLQCDAISAADSEYGAVASAVGNLVSIRLPRRKEEGIVKKIKDHIRAYLRRMYKNNPFAQRQRKINGIIYRLQNKDKINAHRRERYRTDAKYRENVKKSCEKWRGNPANRDLRRALNKKWQDENREHLKQWRRADYHKDVEKSRKKLKERYWANPEHARELANKSYYKNRDKINQRRKELYREKKQKDLSKGEK